MNAGDPPRGEDDRQRPTGGKDSEEGEIQERSAAPSTSEGSRVRTETRWDQQPPSFRRTLSSPTYPGSRGFTSAGGNRGPSPRDDRGFEPPKFGRGSGFSGTPVSGRVRDYGQSVFGGRGSSPGRGGFSPHQGRGMSPGGGRGSWQGGGRGPPGGTPRGAQGPPPWLKGGARGRGDPGPPRPGFMGRGGWGPSRGGFSGGGNWSSGRGSSPSGDRPRPNWDQRDPRDQRDRSWDRFDGELRERERERKRDRKDFKARSKSRSRSRSRSPKRRREPLPRERNSRDGIGSDLTGFNGLGGSRAGASRFSESREDQREAAANVPPSEPQSAASNSSKDLTVQENENPDSTSFEGPPPAESQEPPNAPTSAPIASPVFRRAETSPPDFPTELEFKPPATRVPVGSPAGNVDTPRGDLKQAPTQGVRGTILDNLEMKSESPPRPSRTPATADSITVEQVVKKEPVRKSALSPQSQTQLSRRPDDEGAAASSVVPPRPLVTTSQDKGQHRQSSVTKAPSLEISTCERDSDDQAAGVPLPLQALPEERRRDTTPIQGRQDRPSSRESEQIPSIAVKASPPAPEINLQRFKPVAPTAVPSTQSQNPVGQSSTASSSSALRPTPIVGTQVSKEQPHRQTEAPKKKDIAALAASSFKQLIAEAILPPRSQSRESFSSPPTSGNLMIKPPVLTGVVPQTGKAAAPPIERTLTGGSTSFSESVQARPQVSQEPIQGSTPLLPAVPALQPAASSPTYLPLPLPTSISGGLTAAPFRASPPVNKPIGIVSPTSSLAATIITPPLPAVPGTGLSQRPLFGLQTSKVATTATAAVSKSPLTIPASEPAKTEIPATTAAVPPRSSVAQSIISSALGLSPAAAAAFGLTINSVDLSKLRTSGVATIPSVSTPAKRDAEAMATSSKNEREGSERDNSVAATTAVTALRITAPEVATSRLQSTPSDSARGSQSPSKKRPRLNWGKGLMKSRGGSTPDSTPSVSAGTSAAALLSSLTQKLSPSVLGEVSTPVFQASPSQQSTSTVGTMASYGVASPQFGDPEGTPPPQGSLRRPRLGWGMGLMRSQSQGNVKNSPSASTPDNKEITSDLAAALSMLSSSNTAVRNLEKEMGGAAVQSPLRDDDSGLADKVKPQSAASKDGSGAGSCALSASEEFAVTGALSELKRRKDSSPLSQRSVGQPGTPGPASRLSETRDSEDETLASISMMQTDSSPEKPPLPFTGTASSRLSTSRPAAVIQPVASSSPGVSTPKPPSKSRQPSGPTAKPPTTPVAPTAVRPPSGEDISAAMAQVDSRLQKTRREVNVIRDVLRGLKRASKVNPKPKGRTWQEVPVHSRRILLENRAKSHQSEVLLNSKVPDFFQSSNSQDGFVPLYTKPTEIPSWSINEQSHEVFKPVLTQFVLQRRLKRKTRVEELATQYRQLKKSWRVKLKRIEAYRKREENKKEKQAQEAAAAAAAAASDPPSSTRSSTRGQQGSRDIIRSDYEQQKVVNNLLEQEKRAKRLKTGIAVIPDMILGEEERDLLVFNDNYNKRMTTDGDKAKCRNRICFSGCASDCNCARVVEIERMKTNPWTDIEKIIFLDKFLQYPKNFYKIGTFLANKSTRDVIQFYYLIKQKTDFKALLREQQMKRRGTKRTWEITATAAADFGIRVPVELIEKTDGISSAVSGGALGSSSSGPISSGLSLLSSAAVSASISTVNSLQNGSPSPEGKQSGSQTEDKHLLLTDFLNDNAFDSYKPCVLERKHLEKLQESDIGIVDESFEERDDARIRRGSIPAPTSQATSEVAENESRPGTKKKSPKSKSPRETSGKSKKGKDKGGRKDGKKESRREGGHSKKESRKKANSDHTIDDADVSGAALAAGNLGSGGQSQGKDDGKDGTSGKDSSALDGKKQEREKRVIQKWTEKEKSDFMKFFKEHGKDWDLLTSLIPTKTCAQIKNYYQNYKNRLGLQAILQGRSSDGGPSQPTGAGMDKRQSHDNLVTSPQEMERPRIPSREHIVMDPEGDVMMSRPSQESDPQYIHMQSHIPASTWPPSHAVDHPSQVSTAMVHHSVQGYYGHHPAMYQGYPGMPAPPPHYGMGQVGYMGRHPMYTSQMGSNGPRQIPMAAQQPMGWGQPMMMPQGSRSPEVYNSSYSSQQAPPPSHLHQREEMMMAPRGQPYPHGAYGIPPPQTPEEHHHYMMGGWQSQQMSGRLSMEGHSGMMPMGQMQSQPPMAPTPAQMRGYGYPHESQQVYGRSMSQDAYMTEAQMQGPPGMPYDRRSNSRMAMSFSSILNDIPNNGPPVQLPTLKMPAVPPPVRQPYISGILADGMKVESSIDVLENARANMEPPPPSHTQHHSQH